MTYQERKTAARQADLVEICQRMGIPLEKEQYGKEGEYRVKGQGGLVLWKNGYYHHSNPNGKLNGQPADSGNNAISFVMYYFGKTFNEALDIILGNGYKAYTRHDTSNYKPDFTPAELKALPTPADNNKRVLAYLIRTRGLSESVVKEMLDKGLLYQDERGNAVFVCKDEQGEVIGVEMKGTSTMSAKSYKETRGNAVFRLRCGEPTGVIAFESAIDLLSYYEMHRPQLTHHLLVSLAGCRHEALDQVVTQHPSYKVCIATDNDEKGNLFYDNYRRNHPNIPIIRMTSTLKDWNEDIKAKKGV